MAKNKRLLTAADLDTKPRPNSDVWLSDPGERGTGRIYFRITPGGARSFYFSYNNSKGKRQYLRIGPYDKSGKTGLTLATARAKFYELSLLYQSGVSDIKEHINETLQIEEEQRKEQLARIEAERKAAEIEASRLTVSKLFDKWEHQHLAKKHKDKGTDTRRLFEYDVFDVIGDAPAHMVRKGDVMAIIDSINERGAERIARRVFSGLRQMFRFALERDLVEIDPTAAISKVSAVGRDKERDRWLSDEEIKFLSAQIHDANLLPTTVAAIWIVLSTGCRVGELLMARWEDVDLEEGQWRIPEENTKNGQQLTIGISAFTLEHFKALLEHKRSSWLYPARNKKKGDTHVSTKTITKQITDRQRKDAMQNRSQYTKALALPGGRWTMHDLRRTAATIMGDIGIKPEIIDRCLNHVEPNRIRRTYQRYSYQSEMNEAWQLLGFRLEGLVSGENVAEVIPLHAG